MTGAYERVFLGIAITVTIVWALATLVQVVSPTHIVPTYANLVMMSVAGSFFGGAILSSKRNGNNGSNGSETKEVSKPKKKVRSILDAALDAAEKNEDEK